MMSGRPFHLALIWLAATSLLFQTLGAGAPGGLNLCIGCAEGGWAISRPVASDGPTTCCVDEAETADCGEAPALGSDDCGCIRIAVKGGPDLMVTPRADASTSNAPIAMSVVAFLPASMMPESTWRGRPAPLAASPPPRSTPVSLRTALLL